MIICLPNMSMNKRGKIKSKKGFTLIELLAVIIILGLLLVIAVPAVTKYIEKSRKNSYKATVSAYAGGLMNEISSGNLPSMTDEDTIYYIPFKCINLEKGGTTMYGTGDWDFAYVLMTITNGQRNYSIYSKDSKGMGIVGIDVDKIKQSDIYSIWYKSTDYIPVDGKTKIKLVDDACNFAGMTKIDSRAFGYNQINDIYIPNTVTNISSAILNQNVGSSRIHMQG